MSIEEYHKKFAAGANGKIWNIVDKGGPENEEEKDEIVHLAHASCWHWSKIGEPVNTVRAHYMLGRAYFSVDKKEEGIFWTKKCWSGTEKLGLSGFDLVFGLELYTRAMAAAGDKDKFEEISQKFQDECAKLEEDDKSLCMGEWNKGPWFGLK